ncbi:glycoside-pentoside-hexuronide (GPH):cation symporter [Propionibacteriaceae bacterium G57]|uniref:glycoside-pentoside-hexuronide (GPH):cation symporter n=1 Tax=Aestuariimicrobium sp. G57 TaxID=3418485 RepID=UPI003DA71D47
MTAFSYGIGTLGRDMLAAMVSTYLLFYITEVRLVSGVHLAAITVVMVFMRIFDALNDPFMGMVVDNTRTRWGKFKPWQALGAVLWAVAGVGMFTGWDAQGWAFVAVFFLVYLAYEVSYTINDISYWGMLPSLSRDQAERARIGSVARISASIGLFAVVVGIVPGTHWLERQLGSAQAAWTTAAVIAAGMMLLFQVAPLLGARERVHVVTGNTTLRQLWRAIVRNDQLMWTTLGMVLFFTGYGTTASIAIYFFKYVFGDLHAYTVFAAVLGVTQVVALALFPLVSKVAGRFTIHAWATAMIAVGYLGFLAAGRNLALVLAAAVLMFAGQAAVQLLMVMFIADSVEYGQWKLGRRNESITFALQPFIYKSSGGLSTGIVGAALLLAGIGRSASDPETGPVVIDEGPAWILRVAMIIVPLALVVASWVVLRARYRLDEQTYAGIVADLRAREAALDEAEG